MPNSNASRSECQDGVGRTLTSQPYSVHVYAIAPGTGALALPQKYPGGKGANWVEIVSLD